MISEEGMRPIRIVYDNFPEDDPGTLFEDCLFGKNGYNFAAIDYMVKVSALREMTGMKIYNAYNTGQQRQICLPLYYKYKAWTLAEPLACYFVRKSSVSHGDYAKFKTQAHLYSQSETYINTIFDTISSMPSDERKYYHDKFMQNQALSIALKAIDAHYSPSNYISDYKKFGGSTLYIYHVIFKKQLRAFVKKLLRK